MAAAKKVTARAPAARTAAVVQAELDAYKAAVRRVAIEVAAEQNWCTSGLNERLHELGLEPKAEPIDGYIEIRIEFGQGGDGTVLPGLRAGENNWGDYCIDEDSVAEHFEKILGDTIGGFDYTINTDVYFA